MPVLAVSHTASQLPSTFSDALSLQIASLNALSATENAAYCSVCLSKNHKTSQCFFILEEVKKAFTSFRDTNFKQFQRALHTETTDQAEEAFAPETPSIAEPQFR